MTLNELPEDVKSILAALEMLSERQKEVVKWLADGKSNDVIAKLLAISVKAVEYHLTRIYAKVPVEDRKTLIAIINRYQLVWSVRFASVIGPQT